ncbi:MAG: hypothetical protein ACK4RS_00195 [Thiothrix sp.]
MFLLDDLGRYTANANYISEEELDRRSIEAMATVVCSTTQCANDVDTVLATTGKTAQEWRRGNDNIDALLTMLRCSGLRAKLMASGMDMAAFDGMLASCDVASTINKAMLAHYRRGGV